MSNFGQASNNREISTVEAREEDEPPDSPAKTSFLFLKNKAEPLPSLGSFFVEIVSDVKKCFGLWQKFSPQKTLFDTWEFRYAFYLGYGYQPYFLLLKSQEEDLALLPLWYDRDEKRHVWFGSDWQEEVRIFCKDPKYIQTLFSYAPSPLFLNAISPESALFLKDVVNLEPDEAKYVLNIEKFSSHEDYLMTLKKNDRHSLRKDRRRIERQNPQIIVDDFSNLDSLIELAKKRFKEKGKETDWEDSRRVETFRQVIKLAGPSYRARMIAVKIGEKIAGADLICLFKDTYFTVKCGYNVADFPGIGNFVNLIEIDDAISLGMKKVDFLQNNYTWKSRWFEKVPLFKYQK